MGVTLDLSGDNAPKEAQLKAYQAAEWTAFAFGILGASSPLVYSACYGEHMTLNVGVVAMTGVLLSFFLRGVGIVGHPANEDDKLSDEEEETVHEKERPQTSEEKDEDRISR